MIRAEEIKGIKGLCAFKALHTLLFNYYLLPEFKKDKETYGDFLKRFHKMDDDEKREVLEMSLYFAGIEVKEIETLVSFAEDVNGVHYSKASMNNLDFPQLFEIIIDVCLEVAKIKVFF